MCVAGATRSHAAPAATTTPAASTTGASASSLRRVRGDLAVLFDLDGVIIDSREHHLTAWHQLAREAGLAHAPDYFTSVFGLRNEPIIRGIAPDIAAPRLIELADRKEELFRAAARGRLEMLPGVRELLALLDAASVPK